MDSPLPLINACLNGLAFVLLLWGYRLIRQGQKEAHAKVMGMAFLTSMVFLASYLYYHFFVLPMQNGPTPYRGSGTAKGVYLFILATHVLLAAVNLPMVLRVLWLAHKKRWAAHRAWARWTFPIWLYVSVTGVLVYLILYQWNPEAVP